MAFFELLDACLLDDAGHDSLLEPLGCHDPELLGQVEILDRQLFKVVELGFLVVDRAIFFVDDQILITLPQAGVQSLSLVAINRYLSSVIRLLNFQKLSAGDLEELQELVLLILMHGVVDDPCELPKEVERKQRHEVTKDWEDGGAEATELRENVKETVEIDIVDALRKIEVNI